MYIDLFGHIKAEKRRLFQPQVFIARTTGFDYNSSSYRQAKIYMCGMHTTNITVELPKKKKKKKTKKKKNIVLTLHLHRWHIRSLMCHLIYISTIQFQYQFSDKHEVFLH